MQRVSLERRKILRCCDRPINRAVERDEMHDDLCLVRREVEVEAVADLIAGEGDAVRLVAARAADDESRRALVVASRTSQWSAEEA